MKTKPKRIMDCSSVVRDIFSDDEIIFKAKKGEIPHVKNENGYFFFDDDLNKWLSDHKEKIRLLSNKSPGKAIGPIDVCNKKLKMPSDLNKRVRNIVSLKLVKYDNGVPKYPSNTEIDTYLNDLARENKIKHYRLSGAHGDVFLFDDDDVADITVENVMPERKVDVIKVYCFGDPISSTDNIPIEISSINPLYKIPNVVLNSGPCIYFLCRESKVVYVGQTEVNIYSRLMEHNNNKLFDSVFYMRVPTNKLNATESALIAYLQPEYNQTKQEMSNNRQLIINELITSAVN